MKQHVAILFVICAVASPGCERPGVVGSGVAGTELRDVGDFDEIEFLGVGRLEIATGNLKSLEITADDNILPLLRSEVQGRRLTIRPIGSIRPKVDILVKATAPNIKLVSCAGNPDVSVAGLDNDAFSIQIKGNGKVVARGATGDLTVSIMGNGLVETTDLAARTVDVKITGNGKVLTQAHETLNVSITGAGVVRYRGDPEIHKTVIGSGTVAKQ